MVALEADCGMSMIGLVVKPGARAYSAASRESSDLGLADISGPLRLTSTTRGRLTSSEVLVWGGDIDGMTSGTDCRDA